MRIALFVLLCAASASAQTAPVRPFGSISLGAVSDSLGGMLGSQVNVGVRRGVASVRLRGVRAESVSLGFSLRDHSRWEVAALGGVSVGERAQVFAGAGPGLTGGDVQTNCFLASSSCSDDKRRPTTLGLALALDATVRTSGLTRLGVQSWLNANPTRTVGGVGLLLQVGR